MMVKMLELLSDHYTKIFRKDFVNIPSEETSLMDGSLSVIEDTRNSIILTSNNKQSELIHLVDLNIIL